MGFLGFFALCSKQTRYSGQAGDEDNAHVHLHTQSEMWSGASVAVTNTNQEAYYADCVVASIL